MIDHDKIEGDNKQTKLPEAFSKEELEAGALKTTFKRYGSTIAGLATALFLMAAITASVANFTGGFDEEEDTAPATTVQKIIAPAP